MGWKKTINLIRSTHNEEPSSGLHFAVPGPINNSEINFMIAKKLFLSWRINLITWTHRISIKREYIQECGDESIAGDGPFENERRRGKQFTHTQSRGSAVIKALQSSSFLSLSRSALITGTALRPLAARPHQHIIRQLF
jgi:hypothetical protein